jgi:antitoxin (DNA-binding transcriptional repressor) of toxin-antitoxin stability system
MKPRTKSRNTRNLHFPLREAKNRLSELVRRAARGEQIIITLHGEPRAQLSRVLEKSRPFKADWKWLREMKVAASQTPAEALIRADRDGRD